MKQKKFVQGITFYVTNEMYGDLKEISDCQNKAISEIIRENLEASTKDLKKTATTNSKRRT